MVEYPQALSQLGSPAAWWQCGAEGHARRRMAAVGETKRWCGMFYPQFVFYGETTKLKSQLFLLGVSYFDLWHDMVL